MFNLIMIINNSQNPYAINEIYASKPLRNESTSLSANSMPTDNRVVVETGVSKKALNNAPPNFIRHVSLITSLPVMAHLRRVL